MEKNEKTFATTIREMRERTGWSRRKMSEETGVPYSTIKQWEYGKAEPAEYIKKMFILNVSSLVKTIYDDLQEI